MRNLRYVLAAVILLSSATAAVAQKHAATHWRQHLGPQRNGISPAKELLNVWPAGGPKVVWRKRGGIGMSACAIDGKFLVTLVQDARTQYALALDAATGKQLWKQPVAEAYRNGQGNGPRGTPTISNGNVYVFTGQGILAKLDQKTGKVKWSDNVVERVQTKPAEYGMACSPLVHNGNVVVIAGGQQAAVIAYNEKTGEVRWKAGDDKAGYSSPALLKVGGKLQIVAFLGGSAIGVAPKAGSVLWQYPYVTDFNCNTATAIAIGGDVFLSSGENHGCVRLSLTPKGKRFAPKVVWESQGGGSVLRSEWQTPILLGGYLYGMDNVGSAGPVTHLTCVNAKTGERQWRKTRFGKSNLIAADGKLFITNRAGELVVVRANPKAFEEIGRMKVLTSTRQAASLAGGLLYMRDNRDIVCINVRK